MSYSQINIGPVKTSRKELVDIFKAWIVLSLAFAIVYAGASLFRGEIERVFSANFVVLFLISSITAGLGFLLHELAHKFVAQRYGCMAEFRAFDNLLYLALGLAAAVGFIFAAPGAVMISGRVTRKENGLISLAGPLTNYFLGMVFLILLLQLPAYGSIFQIGFFINWWLGLFNMIPFGNFDGKKILEWSRYAWIAMVAIGIYFVFFFKPGII
ncbi:MAG TPA: metalloprotease [Candidatus Nanoarchaeia archaeon]|nr:metalloprotease [Candidatus Nanoarchaeia archaeon]